MGRSLESPRHAALDLRLSCDSALFPSWMPACRPARPWATCWWGGTEARPPSPGVCLPRRPALQQGGCRGQVQPQREGPREGSWWATRPTFCLSEACSGPAGRTVSRAQSHLSAIGRPGAAGTTPPKAPALAPEPTRGGEDDSMKNPEMEGALVHPGPTRHHQGSCKREAGGQHGGGGRARGQGTWSASGNSERERKGSFSGAAGWNTAP